jgi:hypothetical protein
MKRSILDPLFTLFPKLPTLHPRVFSLIYIFYRLAVLFRPVMVAIIAKKYLSFEGRLQLVNICHRGLDRTRTVSMNKEIIPTSYGVPVRDCGITDLYQSWSCVLRNAKYCPLTSPYVKKPISLTDGTNVLSMPRECGWSCVGATGRLQAGPFRNHDQKHGRLGKCELGQHAFEEGLRSGRNAAMGFKIEGENTRRKYTESTDVA